MHPVTIEQIRENSRCADYRALEDLLAAGEFDPFQADLPQRIEAAVAFPVDSVMHPYSTVDKTQVQILAVSEAGNLRPFLQALVSLFLTSEIQASSLATAAILMRASCSIHDLRSLRSLHAVFPTACNLYVPRIDVSWDDHGYAPRVNAYAVAAYFSFTAGMDFLTKFTVDLHRCADWTKRGQPERRSPILSWTTWSTHETHELMLINAIACDGAGDVLAQPSTICAAADALITSSFQTATSADTARHALWAKYGFFESHHHLYVPHLARAETRATFERYYKIAVSSGIGDESLQKMHHGIMETSIIVRFDVGVELVLKACPPADLIPKISNLIQSAETWSKHFGPASNAQAILRAYQLCHPPL